jgi:hypothetical protein
MPLAHAVFFEEPREFTEEQIEELKTLGLLREDEPAEVDKPAEVGKPAGVVIGPATVYPPSGPPVTVEPEAPQPEPQVPEPAADPPEEQ